MRKIKLIMMIIIVLSTMILSCSYAAVLHYYETLLEQMESQTVTTDEEFSIGDYHACYIEPEYLTGDVWDFGFLSEYDAHPYAIGVYDESTGSFTPLPMAAFFLSGSTGHSTIKTEYDVNPASVIIDSQDENQKVCLISLDPNVSINDLKLQYKLNGANSGISRKAITDISSLQFTAPNYQPSDSSGESVTIDTEQTESLWGTGEFIISGENVTINPDDDTETVFESLAKLIAWLIRITANGLNNIVQFSVNKITDNTNIVTTDDLIFNHFPETSVDFYGNTILTESSLANKFKSSISKWYQRFQAFGLVGYLIILLYIGSGVIFS